MKTRWATGQSTITAFVLLLPTFAAAEQLEQMEFSASRDDRSILPFEPVPLTLSLRNGSDRQVQTTVGLDELGWGTWIFIAFEDGVYSPWYRSWRGNDERGEPLPIEFLNANASVSHAIEVFWQEHVPVFGKEGTYQIKSVWQSRDAKSGQVLARIEFEPLTVMVVAGDATDRACLKAMQEHDLHHYLALEAIELMPPPGDGRSDIVEQLYDVAQRFDESRYSVYCLSTAVAALASLKRPDDAKLVNTVIAYTEQRIAKKPDPRLLLVLARHHLSEQRPERSLELLRKAREMKANAVINQLISDTIKSIEGRRGRK